MDQYLIALPLTLHFLMIFKRFTGVLATKYIHKYFQEDRRNHVGDMAQRVKFELYKNILNSVWLDWRSK